MLTDRQGALALARSVLAADCACAEEAFLTDGVLVIPSEVRKGRRRFIPSPRPLFVATFGTGVAVSCHPDRVPWLQATLGSLNRDAVFSAVVTSQLARCVEADGQTIFGPELKHLCSPSSLRQIDAPSGVAISLVAGDEVRALHRYPGFPNALSYQPDCLRPDVLATVATRGDEVVGIAGASADTDELWQIGIDVVPSAQGRGVGRALVHRLTSEVLRLGKVPYYSAYPSNLHSLALASGVGYWPAWLELRATMPR